MFMKLNMKCSGQKWLLKCLILFYLLMLKLKNALEMKPN